MRRVPPLNIALVSFAEAYQIYHGANVMFELMRNPGVAVTFFYNDPETPHHLERIRRAQGAPRIDAVRLRRGPLAWLTQTGRVFGLAKNSVLHANEAMLSRFDAVVAMEDEIQILFGEKPESLRPARILIDHGAGDRFVPSHVNRGRLDLMLVKGQKVVDQMTRIGVARPGHIAIAGDTKRGTAMRLATPVRFAEQRPTVLYNPHKERGLSSWSHFIQPMLDAFAAQSDFNLIVAPHVKMTSRWSPVRRLLWRRRGRQNILIDTGSERCCDSSYTEAADIYVGDVSSQVYEFLARPRPCVFLNAAGVRWRTDPHFLFWHLGDVVEEPARLMATIRSAADRHSIYAERQRWLVSKSMEANAADADRRAADLIMEYMIEGRIGQSRPDRPRTARVRGRPIRPLPSLELL